MRTTVSLPDQLFAEVERLVRRSGFSRSELYAAALREYMARHSQRDITAEYNKVLSKVDPKENKKFTDAAAIEVLMISEWQ